MVMSLWPRFFGPPCIYTALMGGGTVVPIQWRDGYENLYFTRMIYPVAKQTKNNILTNLTTNTNG